MINFNGQFYNSPDEMPPDVRKMYDEALRIFADRNADGDPDLFSAPLVGNMLRDMLADNDADGIPDVMQGQFVQGSGMAVSSATMIVYDGKTYQSFDELPAKAQQEYRQKMAALNGASLDSLATQDRREAFSPAPARPPVTPQDSPPPIEGDNLESRSLISLPLILFLILACLALVFLGISYFLQP
jgi:hypothetical protein